VGMMSGRPQRSRLKSVMGGFLFWLGWVRVWRRGVSHLPLPPSFVVAVAIKAVIVECFRCLGIRVPVAQIEGFVEDAEGAEVSGWVGVVTVFDCPSLVDLPGAPTTFVFSVAWIVSVMSASWQAGGMVDIAPGFTPGEIVKVFELVFGEAGGSGGPD